MLRWTYLYSILTWATDSQEYKNSNNIYIFEPENYFIARGF